MEYVVFEDLQSKTRITNSSSDDTPVKIHKATSPCYINRKIDATTVRWSCLFDTPAETEEYARQTRKPWKWAKGEKDFP